MRQILGLVVHRSECLEDNKEYHFLITRKGISHPLVPTDSVAPHAKDFNTHTIGIAVFGDFASKEPGLNSHPTPEQITTLIQLCKQLRNKYGDLWIKGHSELGPGGTTYPEKLAAGHTCPGENFPLDEVRNRVLASPDEDSLGDNVCK